VIRVDVGKAAQPNVGVAIMSGASSHGRFRQALAVAADAKLKDSAVPLINEHLAASKNVVCFTYRRAVAEYIAEHAEPGALRKIIHGGISQAQREKSLHGLRSDAENGTLLVATIDAASTGIDLSYADVAVFVELTYEPHELLQAEARLHRFGQRNPVLIQYLIARGTTDELVAEVVLSKLDTLETAIGGFGETALSADLKEDSESIMQDLYRRLGL
jgi:SNF2 family DNA or RNA helicase